ncbi:MAG TPA: helicase-related protein, partial [Candidatus Limnocylindrales bacterium]|nr:helicase-related protein [Candidatus Limnocylindrales bacterium]
RIDRALVFTRTKHGANRLAEQLADDGITAAAIHGNKSQNQRVKALDSFKEGRVAILVATEVAARGIDIDSLPHVVNYELPTVAADYVHRIGRTGRAGVEGDAVSLVCVDEAGLLADIEGLLRQPIPRELIAGFEPTRGLRAEPIPELTRGGKRGRPMSRQAAPHRNVAHGAGHGAPQRRPWASGGAQGARPALGNRPADGSRPANDPRPIHNGPRPPYGQRPMHNGPRPGFDGPRPTFGGPRPALQSLPGERFARTSSSDR